MRNLFALLTLLLACGPLLAAAIPDAMATGTLAQWSPMQGSPKPTLATIGGRQALKMDCLFAGTKIERGSWDYEGPIDLSTTQGVRFKVWCDNTAPVSSFVIFFGSGNGWYRAGFSVESPGQWNDIAIRKEDSTIEGTPAGWGKVDRIRVSAWRGLDENTTFYLADLTASGDLPSVLVVRADSLPAADAKSAAEFAESTLALLREAGIASALISDVECTPELLQKAKLVVLPHNPQMPAPAIDAITAYLNGGGKLLTFYIVPEPLRPIIGIAGGQYRRESRPGEFSSIHPNPAVLPDAPAEAKQHSWNIMEYRPTNDRARIAATWHDAAGQSTNIPAMIITDRAVVMSHVLLPGDAPAKRRLLLAMAGTLVPDVRRDAATQMFQNITRLATDLGAAGRVQQARPQVDALIEEGKYADAMQRSQQLRADILDAYYRAQTAVPNEHRAVWIHSAFGVSGKSWDEAIKLLADNGFTAVFPNMLWGGSAFYKSDVLPVSPEVATRGDQIAECLAACRKYGLEIHVWKVNWNMGWSAPQEFMQKMKAAGRTQVSFSGKEEDRWLCPSHPENQNLEIAAMVEVATKYDVDGIHFDYIRYPGPENCFCNGCKDRFQKHLGREVSDWPRAIRSDAKLTAAWNDFRQGNITRVVREVSEKVRAAGKKTNTRISAAVFSNYPADRYSVAQDWKLWCEQGYLDFVCPMDYTASPAEFRNLVSRQTGWAGKAAVYPGIGVSVWPGADRDVVKLIDMIKTTRELGCKGFTIFEYNVAEANEVVPALGKGITRKQEGTTK